MPTTLIPSRQAHSTLENQQIRELAPHRLAGVGILVSGFAAMMVHSAGYFRLERAAKAAAAPAEPQSPQDAEPHSPHDAEA